MQTGGRISAGPIAFRARYLLILYYAVTLGIPLVRGSYREPDFWQHALFVILIPPAFVIPLAVVAKMKARYASSGPFSA